MDHQQATESMAVEQYLLSELTPEMRDQFEEHFFDCQECATDLRVTAGFIDAAKRELQMNPARQAKPLVRANRRLALLRPVLAWTALAASLLVIAYQNAVVYPRYQAQIAELTAPEILPTLSLVGGNSRGGEIPGVIVGVTHSFLLSLDIPTQDKFSSYTCLLYSPSGSLVWRAEVSAESAKDTVAIRVSSTDKPPGLYTLAVQGNGAPDASGPAAQVAHFRFNLNVIRIAP